MPRPNRLVGLPLSCLVLLGALSCQSNSEGSDRVIARSIDRYGGDRFENIDLRFDFRGTPFRITRREGRFRYERTLTDPDGRTVTEVMENEGTWAEIGGSRVDLNPDEIYDLESAVNSVVYFGFLPFRLDDSAVMLRNLGVTSVGGESYDKIEVTFEQEGGGVDWDARFVYWIRRDDATLDYLAYSYTRDGGGARFRRAVNRREVGGLTIQDYENYAGDPGTQDIAEFDRLFESGDLELLSMVELEDVEVGT